jgi:hypothetical protein
MTHPIEEAMPAPEIYDISENTIKRKYEVIVATGLDTVKRIKIVFHQDLNPALIPHIRHWVYSSRLRENGTSIGKSLYGVFLSGRAKQTMVTSKRHFQRWFWSQKRSLKHFQFTYKSNTAIHAYLWSAIPDIPNSDPPNRDPCANEDVNQS